MSILFYDHLVDKHEIIIYIENLPEPNNHKGRLRQLVDDILHQGLVDFILEKLHPHHHHTFLSRIEEAPYDPEIIVFLKEHASDDIEDQIVKEANKLVSLIKKDLGIPDSSKF